jgi:hypothetical protein
MAFPAVGHAATTGTTDAQVAVASELTLVADPTSTLTPLTHATSATGSTDVKVTSTNAAWALTATDGDATGRGHLTGTGVGTTVGTTLTNPLGVTVTGGTAESLELETGVSVAGSLNETKTFTFTQALGAAEQVRAGAYELTVTYTVS